MVGLLVGPAARLLAGVAAAALLVAGIYLAGYHAAQRACQAAQRVRAELATARADLGSLASPTIAPTSWRPPRSARPTNSQRKARRLCDSPHQKTLLAGCLLLDAKRPRALIR